MVMVMDLSGDEDVRAILAYTDLTSILIFLLTRLTYVDLFCHYRAQYRD